MGKPPLAAKLATNQMGKPPLAARSPE